MAVVAFFFLFLNNKSPSSVVAVLFAILGTSRAPRQLRPKPTDYWRTIFPFLADDGSRNAKMHFRMTRETFNWLVERLSYHSVYEQHENSFNAGGYSSRRCSLVVRKQGWNPCSGANIGSIPRFCFAFCGSFCRSIDGMLFGGHMVRKSTRYAMVSVT